MNVSSLQLKKLKLKLRDDEYFIRLSKKNLSNLSCVQFLKRKTKHILLPHLHEFNMLLSRARISQANFKNSDWFHFPIDWLKRTELKKILITLRALYILSFSVFTSHETGFLKTFYQLNEGVSTCMNIPICKLKLISKKIKNDWAK